jgi:gas vesicle protein
MNVDTQEQRHGGFKIGLVAGAVAGASLAMCLVPQSGSVLRGQVGDSAKRLGRRASDRGRKFGNEFADVYARGSHVP